MRWSGRSVCRRMRSSEAPRVPLVPLQHGTTSILTSLDEETAVLVRLAACLAGGTEEQLRGLLTEAAASVRVLWVEEVILQTYLFAGFPRALNGMREWRRISGAVAPEVDSSAVVDREVQARLGEETCAVVYGPWYERLRQNIRALHPSLDVWMIEEGYGKVLARGALDLGRRELCIVAACAISRQDRQLHSHLHGALHAGVAASAVSATLDLLSPILPPEDLARYRVLWSRVQGMPVRD